MALEAFDAWLCVDCALIIANDDDSGIEDPEAHREAMIEHLRYSDGYLVIGNSDDDLEFSAIPCDGCGTTLAGYRFAAAELVETHALAHKFKCAVSHGAGDPCLDWSGNILGFADLAEPSA